MKGKILRITAIVALVALTGLNFMKANSESATQGYSLLTLSGITDADAACEDEKEMNNGRCSTLTGMCYVQSTPVNCNSMAM